MKKPYLLTLLLCCLSFIAMAQQYPVQGFLRINAPYPAFLSDYASPYSNKLNLSLTLTDLTLPDCRVRLRFTIARQNGVVARNADFLQSGESVIILSGGIPHTLTSTELAPYFRPENLQGLSPDAYSSQLPEGMYTFSVEVFDYFTGRKLSASIGQMLWIMLSEPPLLEEPANKARLADFMEPASTGNIIFRWTSRSAIAAYTEYTFTLCEIWDEQGDPYRQFLASIPKYQTTTPATTLLYGPADPPLLPGKLYAWRVQAKAKEGLETVGLYRQNGESEIRLFRYGSNCPKMTDYRVEVKSDTRIYLSWTAPLNALPGTGYKVAWHKIDPPGKWPWHEAPATTDNYYYLNDLKPGSDYELKVGVVCPEGQQSGAEPEVIYGNIQRTTTLPQGKIAGVECGRTPPPVDLSNQTLIDELKVGDAVMAADCEHVITKLSGDKNGWSGECYVEEPMLGGIRLKMTFKNIRVNTDKRMIAGAFYSVYNPNAPSIINAGKTIDEAKTLVENAVGSVADLGSSIITQLQLNFGIPDNPKFTYDKENGNLMVYDTSGNLQKVEMSQNSQKQEVFPITVKDKEGNLYELGEVQSVDKKIIELTVIKPKAITNSTTSTSSILKKTKPYYLIEGNKFYDGDTIYFPLSNKKYELVAYQDSLKTLFKKGSVWTGIKNSDSHKAYFIPNVVSSSLNGNSISTLYTDSINKVQIRCNIVVVSVDFEEDPNQKWGFDENDNKKEDLYLSYKKYMGDGIPWKSLQKGKKYQDNVIVNVKPVGGESKVRLIPSSPLITTDSLVGSSSSSIKISSDIKTGYIKIKVGKFENDSMRLNIVAYDLLTKTINIVNIDEENDDIQVISKGSNTISDTTVVVSWGSNKFLDTKLLGDDRIVYRSWAKDSVIIAGLNRICDTKANNLNIVSTNLNATSFETEINNVYKYAVVKVNINYMPAHLVINYDLNKDSCFETNNYTELGVVKNKVAFNTLCLLDYPSDNNKNGQYGFKSRAGFFYYKKKNGTIPSNIYKTAAHELGHGQFELDHPFHDIREPLRSSYPARPNAGSWVSKDTNTIMEWDGGWPRDKVRKYQWDDIRGGNTNVHTQTYEVNQ